MCAVLVLKELPLVSYVESSNQSEGSQPGDDTDTYPQRESCIHKLALLDNMLQKEKAARLLDSAEPNLVDMLAKTLSQIDTSKM